jgi:hypothetical protein
VGPKTGQERESILSLATAHPESVLFADGGFWGVEYEIESVFANLKRQMRLNDHRAKTTPGLAQRIAQRLLALTVGIFCNTLAGRPPRALAAYDGR